MTDSRRDSTTEEDTKRDALLQLLAAEVDAAAAASSSAGWTPFAALVAMGSLVWLGLEVLEKGQLQWERVLLLYAAVISFLHAMRASSGLLTRPSNLQNRKPRFLSLEWYLAAGRPGLLVALVNWVALAVLVAPAAVPVSWFATLIVEAFLVTNAAVVMIALALSFVTFPVELGAAVRHAGWSFVLLGPVGLLAACMLGALGLQPFDPLPISEMRLGGLLAGFVFVGEYLADSPMSRVDSSQLQAIRRELLLGEIHTDEAHKRTATVLNGMTVEDYTRGEATETRSSAAELAESARSARAGAGPVHDVMTNPAAVDAEALGRFRAELAERQAGHARLVARLAQLRGLRTKVGRRLAWAEALCPNVKPASQAVLAELDDAITIAADRIAHLGEFLAECKLLSQPANEVSSTPAA